jgi:hypothetical protein
MSSCTWTASKSYWFFSSRYRICNKCPLPFTRALRSCLSCYKSTNACWPVYIRMWAAGRNIHCSKWGKSVSNHSDTRDDAIIVTHCRVCRLRWWHRRGGRVRSAHLSNNWTDPTHPALCTHLDEPVYEWWWLPRFSPTHPPPCSDLRISSSDCVQTCMQIILAKAITNRWIRSPVSYGQWLWQIDMNENNHHEYREEFQHVRVGWLAGLTQFAKW